MPRWLFTSLLGLGGVAALLVATAPSLSPSGSAFRPALSPDPVPATDGAFTVTTDLDYAALVSGITNERNLVITVRAPESETAARRTPVDLAVVVDTSGSMSDEGKFDEARRALHALAEQLADSDQLSLVTFSSFTSSPVALGPASQTGPLAAALLDRTTPGGSTFLSGGMNIGFASLNGATGIAGRVHRVLLMTDGRANQGVVDTAGLSALARAHDGVSVSTIGLGLDYDEGMLSAMADAGGGEYHYVGHDTDLAAVYTEELRSASSVIATGATLDVTFPTGVHATRACSWSSETQANGLRVRLGDLSAGQTRTIVIPVTIDADLHDALASVTVNASSPSGGTLSATASTGTFPIVAASEVDAYEHAQADAAATRALAGESVENAREAWNRGDEAGAKGMLSTGSEYVRAKRADARMDKASADALDADLQQLQSLGYMDSMQGAKAASTVSRQMSR